MKSIFIVISSYLVMSSNVLLTRAPIVSYSRPKVYTAFTSISILLAVNNGGTVPGFTYTKTTNIMSNDTIGSTFINNRIYLSFGTVAYATKNLHVTDADHNLTSKTTSSVVTTIASGGVQGSAYRTGTVAGFYSQDNNVEYASGNIYVSASEKKLIGKVTPKEAVTIILGNCLKLNIANFCNG